MSKQFQVIEKNGQKYLRELVKQTLPLTGGKHHLFPVRLPEVPYLGSHPEGSVLDESELRQIYQVKYNTGWSDSEKDRLESMETLGFETRTVYTDAEPYYPGIDYQPLFNHMSKNYDLTLTTSEMDEIIAISAYILK